MLKINKLKEPLFFLDYKNNRKINSWDSYTTKIKRKLKDIMLRYEQNYYCPYCERVINIKNSQIEHIKPKQKYPNLLNDYNNFITACIEYNRTCGSFKGNKWDDKFLDPTLKDPKDYLTYELSTGRIIPVNHFGEINECAIKTIEILNLNESKLCSQRKRYIKKAINKDGTLNLDFVNSVKEFPSLKNYLFNLLDKKGVVFI